MAGLVWKAGQETDSNSKGRDADDDVALGCCGEDRISRRRDVCQLATAGRRGQAIACLQDCRKRFHNIS